MASMVCTTTLVMERNVTLVVGKRLCWSDALLYCRDFHSDLLSIRGAEEQEMIQQLVAAFASTSRVNVATDGTATQSSKFTCNDQNCVFDGSASHAIDGIDNTAASCTLTKKEFRPWWRLQLTGVYKVAEIEVTNRIYSPEWLVGTEILIGNSENTGNNSRCVTIISKSMIQTFQCRGMEGRFIDFYKPCVEGQVQFCEVRVYGELVPPPLSTSTLAMKRNVTLVLGKRLCWSDALLYCRDFHSDLLSIRGPKEQEMIQQLVAEGQVQFCEVKVYGVCTTTLVMERNVTLVVGKRLCWSDALLYCRDFHSDLLSIRGAEEQEMIQQLVAATSRVNVATKGTAWQSSTHIRSGPNPWSGPAHKAIDGNSDSDSSCILTNKQFGPWWRLQLPDVYKVAEIEVTNRKIDAQRLIGTEILIGNSKNINSNFQLATKQLLERCATIISDSRIQTFQCRGMEGRFIYFYKPCKTDHLQFCEIKVFGELRPHPLSTSMLVMKRNVTLVVGKRLCWSDALLYCRDYHSDLLSIRGPKEEEMIKQLVAEAPVPPTSHLWVGLRRCTTITSDVMLQTFQCMGMEGRFIHFSKPCVQGVMQVCEVKVYGELVPPPLSTSTLVMGRSVILVLGKRLCWSDALLYCRDFHSDLLSIRGPDEQEMIQQLVAGPAKGVNQVPFYSST
ncbi:hypothetical protein CRUP_027961, partial [Coryphaenoides rupestris]